MLADDHGIVKHKVVHNILKRVWRFVCSGVLELLDAWGYKVVIGQRELVIEFDLYQLIHQ